jgi:glycosyltransferase involved in cell wall biosynthesis
VKIAVYTIALNEAAHAERWAASAADADYRIVADTGSTDDTVERLTRAGVTVHRIAVRPWRFDVARNTAMALIPSDVEVCCTMDMDMFLEPGWRPQLEAAWTSETTALYCQLVWRASADDPTPLKGYLARNFHRRWRSFHDMPDFYRSVDAVLITSVTEGAQLPVKEGAAAGRLVISTPVGDFPLRAYHGVGIIAPIESQKIHKFRHRYAPILQRQP